MLVQASREDLTGPDGAPQLTDIRMKTDISQRKRHAELAVQLLLTLFYVPTVAPSSGGTL